MGEFEPVITSSWRHVLSGKVAAGKFGEAEPVGDGTFSERSAGRKRNLLIRGLELLVACEWRDHVFSSRVAAGKFGAAEPVDGVRCLHSMAR